MTSYSFIEPLIVGLIVVVSMIFALRQTLPQASAFIGRQATRCGLPQSLSARVFGVTKQRDCGCGQCSGCGPAKPSQQTISVHRGNSCH